MCLLYKQKGQEGDFSVCNFCPSHMLTKWLTHAAVCSDVSCISRRDGRNMRRG